MEESQIPRLIKIGKGNEVIGSLYKLVYPRIRSYIVRQRGKKEDASDVFQDAIFLFYKQVMEDKFNEKYTVYGYIYKLALNRWLNKLKKDQRLVLYGDIIENYDDLVEEEFAELDSIIHNKSKVDLILCGVGDKCKELLIYKFQYNLSTEDIMLRMGFTSEGAVKMQLKRCKEKLYKIVQENPSIIKVLKDNHN